jgi:hypothetical protein
VSRLVLEKKIEHDFVCTGDAETVRARLLLVCDCCVEYGSDPDHGSKWSLEQAVVSFGEVRRFNLKRIQGGEGASSAEKRAQDAEPEHSFHVRNGDVVHMFADCQDKFLHSVSKAQGVRLLPQGVRLLLAQSFSRFIFMRCMRGWFLCPTRPS